MNHINFMVSEVANGYTVNAYDGYVIEPEALIDCYVAKSREEVGTIVKAICDEAFGKARPTQDKEGEE